VLEDVKRMLIKAHYGHHYVIIDRGARVCVWPGTNLLSDVSSAESLISSQSFPPISQLVMKDAVKRAPGNDPRSALFC